MAWVLRETISSESRGRPIYFERMTGIGPKNTADLEKADKFDSKEDALRSPAMNFSLTNYEPEEV